MSDPKEDEYDYNLLFSRSNFLQTILTDKEKYKFEKEQIT